MSTPPPARRCACVDYDAYDCARARYGTPTGCDEEGEGWFLEPCECCCHEEFRDWCDDDD